MKRQTKTGDTTIHMKKLILIIIATCLYLGNHHPLLADGNIQVNAQLTNHKFNLNEVGQLTVTITGVGSAKPHVPETSGLLFHQRGQQRSMQVINGSISHSLTTMYLIKAEKPGMHTVPPISIKVEGKTYSSKPIEFQVVDIQKPSSQKQSKNLSTATQPDNNTSEPAYIKLLPNKDKGYVGEIVPLTIRAYFRVNVREIGKPILHGDGIVMSELQDEPEQFREVINGQEHIVLEWNTQLSGVKEGVFPISISLDSTIILRNRRTQPSSIFGNRDPFGSSLFDDFFNSGYQQRQLQLSSAPLEFAVLDLPKKNQPDNFSGAIGSFSISATAKPVTVQVGEPITLELMINGKGNFDRVQCPTFPGSSDFRTYKPVSSFTENVKKFERALIPESAIVSEIPSHSMTYFDPDKKEYVVVHSEPIPIKVHGTANFPAPPPQKVSSNPQPSSVSRVVKNASPPISLAPQKLYGGKQVPHIAYLYQQGWFKFSCALLFLLLTLRTIYLLMQRVTPDSLKKQHLAVAKAQLKTARNDFKILENNDDPEYIILSCRKIVQDYLAVLWSIEPATITLSDITNRLGAQHQLSELFGLSDKAEYGRLLINQDATTSYLTEIQAALESIK